MTVIKLKKRSSVERAYYFLEKSVELKKQYVDDVEYQRWLKSIPEHVHKPYFESLLMVWWALDALDEVIPTKRDSKGSCNERLFY